ncbi:alpha-tectorin-like [Lithobates pipiens]
MLGPKDLLQHSREMNTFQVVLSTDGNLTFLLYNYEDIQWPSIYAYGYYQHGPLSLAGLNSGYDTGYYTLPGSLSLDIANLANTSNVNLMGRWAFRVDQQHPEDANGNLGRGKFYSVNNNGLLSFSSPISQYTPQALPVALGNPFLAIFWADIDNRLAGDIYYRETTDPSLLSRATDDIRTYFHGVNFTARWVFVATWHRVAYYESSTSKVNTFQAVLSTDGNRTFLLYNYEDIQWPSIYGYHQHGPLSLAGLNSGYDTGYYTLPGSLSLDITNLANKSNVNFTGRWAFRVDQQHPEDANGNIDEANKTVTNWTTATPSKTAIPPTTSSGLTSTVSCNVYGVQAFNICILFHLFYSIYCIALRWI